VAPGTDTQPPLSSLSSAVVDLDPHCFDEPGPGSALRMRIRIQERKNLPELTTKLGFLPFERFLYEYLCRYVLVILECFSFKNSTFCDFKCFNYIFIKKFNFL
jgi:hypothetical protein